MHSTGSLVTLGEPRAESDPEHPRPWAVECRGLVRRFGGVPALDGVSLEVARGEFFSLLGPSGCGKTTLLRILAGLDRPNAGTVWLAGRDVTDVPPQQRPLNMVFQSYALFPHLSVYENVAFGLRMRRLPETTIARKVAEILALARIEDLAPRRPAQLSGGQQQRVALARALVNEPEVLLLDEPLGALDLQLRRQLQTELRQMQRRLGLTFLHVTHDQEEALALSDRIAVMNRGRIEQVGRPREVYDRPRTRFVAQFLGLCNLIAGRAEGGDGLWMRLTTTAGPLRAAVPDGPHPSAAGQEVTLAIRPERVKLYPATRPPPGANGWHGRVDEVIFRGAALECRIQCGPERLWAISSPGDGAQPVPTVGEPVFCHFPPEALNLLHE